MSSCHPISTVSKLGGLNLYGKKHASTSYYTLLFYAIYSPTVLKTDSSNTEIIIIMANMG